MKQRERIKKVKRGEKNLITTLIKLVVSLVVLLLQFGLIYLIYYSEIFLEAYYRHIYEYLSIAVKALGIIYVLYTHEKPAYKIPWIILFAFLPLFALVIYFIYGKSKMNKRLKRVREETLKETLKYMPNNYNVILNTKNEDEMLYRRLKYLQNVTSYPVCKNEGIEYFHSGEECFKEILKDLKRAKKYILIEFFIVARGKLWDEIYDILKEKAKSGVEVSIIADEWGSITRFPKHLFKEAQNYGIEVHRFNPIKYGINNYMNYRDHRKIVVVDGNVAYTGGVNIADEYINQSNRFGHWKDNGIKVTGDVVKSFTLSFLRNLQIASKTVVDYEWYMTEAIDKKQNLKNNEKGIVQYFSDGPDNRKNPGESAYIQLLNTAKNYVYIYTPYFVVSDEVLNAILNASRSGIDIRIITPYNPDKWYVHMTTRSYYEVLINAGVRVYEYEPGFLHAKTMLSDDKSCIIGSMNLDFRSSNLNYECSILTYDTGVELDIKEDFIATMDKSIEIKLEDVKKKNIFIKAIEAVLNTFAPLM
ncbi:MAG: cardiolipin synthase [Clostridia bacterium]|nr:cardiolipin synthase [Clostridia bacterium]